MIAATLLAVTLAVAPSPAPSGSPSPPPAHDMMMHGDDMMMHDLKMPGGEATMPPMHMDGNGTSSWLLPSRDGSGTSWVPDRATMFGTMHERDGAATMVHGALFARYVEGAANSGRGADAPGMMMWMRAVRTGAASVVRFRAMTHVDALTIHGRGYPELYQTGEDFGAQHISDHQHPHDLAAELSVDLARRGRRGGRGELYLADPGEPALGPPAFPHRRIGYDLASSPLGHHWLDSTHIAYGVVTAGAGGRDLKFELSRFNGHEPDQIRTNFERPRLDASAARVSWNPGPTVSTQVSLAKLRSPEQLHPGLDQRRLTASVLFEAPRGTGVERYGALMWGRKWEDRFPTTAAFLAEGLVRHGTQTWFARAERVTKDADDLGYPPVKPLIIVGDVAREPLHVPGITGGLPPQIFTARIAALTVGGVHDLRTSRGAAWTTGLGAAVSVARGSRTTWGRYGTGAHVGGELFLRLRPPAHDHAGHAH